MQEFSKSDHCIQYVTLLGWSCSSNNENKLVLFVLLLVRDILQSRPNLYFYINTMLFVCFIDTSSGVKVSYMTDTSLHIVYTSVEPSLALIYDSQLGIHSAWRIQKAKIDVSKDVCTSVNIHVHVIPCFTFWVYFS